MTQIIYEVEADSQSREQTSMPRRGGPEEGWSSEARLGRCKLLYVEGIDK